MKRLLPGPMSSLTKVALLALLFGMVGCGQQAADQASNTTTAAPIVAATTEDAAPQPEAATPITAPVTDLAAEPGEQITETGSAESVEPATNAQPLALRIAEVKPEPVSAWKEGVHYVRLLPTQPTSAMPGQVEVAEVFWYGCPHCYALDPLLENWRKTKPAFISFVRIPVMWGTVHRTHARVFYTAEALGKLDELHGAIFDEIHKRNNPLTSVDRIQAFFTSQSVSDADFQKAFSSMAIESSLKRAEALGLRYKVESVPLIIINGKYVTDVGRAGGQAQLISLINELASRERSI